MNKVMPICKIQKMNKPIDKKQKKKDIKNKKSFDGNFCFQEIFDKCKLLEGDLK